MGGWPAGAGGALAGARVALEPLEARHEEELWSAASEDAGIWRWLTGEPPTRAAFADWVAAAVGARERGDEWAYATRELAGGTLVGSTRFMALRPDPGVVEIGWTWLVPRAHRTGVNVEAKLLMLGHAFDALGCVRVELKTHAANTRSRGAMARLGATFEGVARKQHAPAGIGVRDTAWFAVVDDDWPAVRAGLRARCR